MYVKKDKVVSSYLFIKYALKNGSYFRGRKMEVNDASVFSYPLFHNGPLTVMVLISLEKVAGLRWSFVTISLVTFGTLEFVEKRKIKSNYTFKKIKNVNIYLYNHLATPPVARR